MGFGQQIFSTSTCPANILIDKRPADVSEFWARNVDEIAWVEVYPRGPSVPVEFVYRLGCGVIAVFARHFLRN